MDAEKRGLSLLTFLHTSRGSTELSKHLLKNRLLSERIMHVNLVFVILHVVA